MVAEWGLLETSGGPCAQKSFRSTTMRMTTASWSCLAGSDGGAAGASALGGSLDDRREVQGRRRPQPRGIARPGLISPDQAAPAEYRRAPPAGARAPRRLGAIKVVGAAGSAAVAWVAAWGSRRRRWRRGRRWSRWVAAAAWAAVAAVAWAAAAAAWAAAALADFEPGWEPQQPASPARTISRSMTRRTGRWPNGRSVSLPGSATWLWPLRWLAYLTPVTVGLGLWTVFTHFDAFFADYSTVSAPDDAVPAPAVQLRHRQPDGTGHARRRLRRLWRRDRCASASASRWASCRAFCTQIGSLAGLDREPAAMGA